MERSDEVRRVSVEAFGRKFVELLPEHAEDLRTLESEGALYSDFADFDDGGRFTGSFTRYKIVLTPAELFDFVNAHIAYGEFMQGLRLTDDFAAAADAVKDMRYRSRLLSYQNYGHDTGKTGDIRGCLASFLGPDLEALVCGGVRERYEALPALGSQANQDSFVTNALRSVAQSAQDLKSRAHGRPAFVIENEYDVQDVVALTLRSIFSDVHREEWTPPTRWRRPSHRFDHSIRGSGY